MPRSPLPESVVFLPPPLFLVGAARPVAPGFVLFVLCLVARLFLEPFSSSIAFFPCVRQEVRMSLLTRLAAETLLATAARSGYVTVDDVLGAPRA